MFGTIRKHQNWLWGIIIAVTIISFVIFFSPSSRLGGQRGREGNHGTIAGKPITDEDLADAYRESELRFFLSYGKWPDAEMKQMGYDPDREAYQRLFLVQKLKDYDIQVDSSSVAKAGNSILTGLGRGNRVPLEAFVKQVLAPKGMNENDFERYLRHQLGIEQLISVVGTSGKLVTPAEAQSIYVREQQEISADAAFFNASNYLSAVAAPTPDALAQFYTNHMRQYEIPDRLQVAYVRFDATNFLKDADAELAKQTNFSAFVDEQYIKRGTNYFKGLSADEAKAKIRDEVRHQFALNDAYKKANDFAVELDQVTPQKPENLASLAKTNGLTPKISAPFSDYPPEEIGSAKDFVNQAKSLGSDAPFQTVLGSDAVFVIALDKKIPAEIPSLEKIRAHVEADYKMTHAAMQARKAGFEFSQALTNGLAHGKTFAGICSDAKVKPTTLPPFSLATRELPQLENEISLNQLKQIAFDTPVGKSSGFVPTMEGGVVVFVRERMPVDQAKMRADMPAYIENLRRTRENEAVNLWFSREASRDSGFQDILQLLNKRNQRGA